MRLTKLAARLYPRWWRERYGDEFAALIEDARPGFGGALDIIKGALAMQIGTPISAKRVWLMGALAGLVIGWTASYWMPSNYRSSAVLQFQGVPNATNQDILEAVNRTANVTLSRQSLATLIRDFKLYPDERNRMPWEEVFEIMRRNVTLKPASVLAQGSGETTFQISFTYPNRFMASRVVAEITKLMTASSGLVVVDPASLPVVPLTPNRIGMITWGLVVGFAMGGIVALAIYVRRLQRRVAELSATP